MNDTLIVIAAVLGVALVGLFVLSRDVKRPSNIAYALMTLSFIILVSANLFTYRGVDDASVVLWCIRLVAVATTAVLTCLYFLLQFLAKEAKSRRYPRALNLSVLIASLAVVIMNVTPFVFSAVNFIGETTSFTVDVSYGAAVFALHAIGVLALSIIHLFNGAMHDKRVRRGQHVSILIGVAPTLLIAPVTSFVMPVLFDQPAFVALTPLYVMFFIVMVAYAMIRHGLFDIRLAVVRTVTYVLTLATLAGIYLGIAFLVFDQLLGQAAESSQIFLNVSLTILLAFIFQPIKRFFDRATNKLFYKDSYDVNEFYGSLNKTISSTTDLRTLLSVVSHLIARTLKAEHVSLVVLPRAFRYISVGTEGYRKLSRQDAEIVGERLRGPALLSNLEDVSLRRLMQSYRLSLILPIYKDGAVMGLLCFGEHKNSDYAKRDIRVMETITDELSIAIQNALSIQEVKDINATLQQRIDAATKELRASNAQLQKLDEAKDEFISMASHQLRTPLTSIKGYISMLVEGDVGAVTKEQKHLLEEAFLSSERMVRLIGDFLNVSRLQTGKFVIEKKPVNLAALVASEIEALESNAATRNLKFVYKRPTHFPELMIDENKFQQVIMNFADNAIYYSKEGSKITVGLREVDGKVEFTVKDTGIGVPAAQQDQLFSKFFRATNARQQRPDGTGVGLFLAKKVIDAHGGTVVFESKEGKGSTFGFRLPIKKLQK